MSRKRPHGRSPAVYAEIRGFYTYTYASNVVEESVSDLHAGLIPASQITVLSFFFLYSYLEMQAIEWYLRAIFEC